MDGRSSPAPARSSSTPPQWRARAGQLRSARWSASVFSAISHSGRCAACASKPSLASAQRQSSAQTFVDGISRLCIMSVVRFIVTGSVRICIRIQELLRIQTDVRVIRTRHTNITTAHTRKQAQSTTARLSRCPTNRSASTHPCFATLCSCSFSPWSTPPLRTTCCPYPLTTPAPSFWRRRPRLPPE